MRNVMINALTIDEIASISQGDLLILLRGLQARDRTLEVMAARSRVVDRLMDQDRVRMRRANPRALVRRLA